MTGEPLRDVNFVLPPNSIAALRQLPGYKDFTPATEVLHCLKPGTGSADAPRAFHLKLAKVTRNKCNLTPTKTDNELLILHRNGVLVAIVALFTDFALAGAPQFVVAWLLLTTTILPGVISIGTMRSLSNVSGESSLGMP